MRFGALEEFLVGQYRQAGGATVAIGAGQRSRVEIRTDQATGGRGFLDLGDQSVFAADRRVLQRGAETAGSVASRGDGLAQAFRRNPGLPDSDLRPRIGADAKQNVGNGTGIVWHCASRRISPPPIRGAWFPER